MPCLPGIYRVHFYEYRWICTLLLLEKDPSSNQDKTSTWAGMHCLPPPLAFSQPKILPSFLHSSRVQCASTNCLVSPCTAIAGWGSWTVSLLNSRPFLMRLMWLQTKSQLWWRWIDLQLPQYELYCKRGTTHHPANVEAKAVQLATIW